MESKVIAIVAIGSKTRALGKDGDLLWKIPEDLRHFKEATNGHPIIMGRKTWESLPRKPLPGRTNIVLTRASVQGNSLDTSAGAPLFVHSPEEALEAARSAQGGEKIYIIGGGQIYKLMLPYTDTLDLTIIEEQPNDISLHADTFFPEYESGFTKELSRENREYKGLKYSFVKLQHA